MPQLVHRNVVIPIMLFASYSIAPVGTFMPKNFLLSGWPLCQQVWTTRSYDTSGMKPGSMGVPQSGQFGASIKC